MKNILALLLCVWCGLGWTKTAAELLNDGKNTENVTTFGMGYDLKMYSPLKQINKSNIKRLVPIWNFSLSNDMGELSQPTIYNGVMYVVNGNWTFAIDMTTGKEIWKTKFGEWKESYGGIVQPTIANGVLISGMAGGDRTARGFVDGYDPDTGKQLWRRWTIPAPGEPGSETWPNKDLPDAWKYGGGATWQPGSYDPQLGLF